MTSWMRPRPRPINYQVQSAKAARALFVDRGSLPRIQLTFIVDDGTTVEVEMEAQIAGVMIEQAMSAYNAILPPLKTSRGGFGL